MAGLNLKFGHQDATKTKELQQFNKKTKDIHVAVDVANGAVVSLDAAVLLLLHR